jgi:Ser/Thr protein kinase RdoA (MazF antagonist)
MLGQSQVDELARRYRLGAGARLTGVVERGEQGQIAQLATELGMWAVKVGFEGYESDEDGEGVAFQMAAQAAGIPVPGVVTASAGDVVADVGGVIVRVYEWVELLPADRTLDPERVGALVAGIHRVEFAGSRPQDPWYTDPVGAAGWDSLIAQLTSAQAPFTAELVELRDELVAVDALVEPARDLRTCHRDLWADNIRVTGDGGLCVIDWDNCGLADPGQELSGVLFEFWGGDSDRARALYRAYRRAGGPGRVDRRGSFSMTIAQLGHIAEAACRIWLDPATSRAERDRQVGRVAEYTDDPLTVDMIDAIVDAVRA